MQITIFVSDEAVQRDKSFCSSFMINRISSRDMSRLMSQLTTRSPYANVCTRSVYSLSRVVIIRRAVYIFLDTVALKDNTCLCVDAVWICIPCHQKKKKAFPPLLLALFQFCLHNVLSRKTTGECSKVCVTECESEREAMEIPSEYSRTLF